MSGRGFYREGQTASERQRAAAARARKRSAVASPFRCGDGMQYVDVDNRLSRVKEMDAEQLRAVVALPGCQKIQALAADRRLRKLEKEKAV